MSQISPKKVLGPEVFHILGFIEFGIFAFIK